ncbi:MAG: YciI family protein [Gallionella sp.]
MWYAIIGEDVPNSTDRRIAARPAHVARLQELQRQGRLLLAGPFPVVDAVDPGVAGFTGSLIIAEFTSLPAAHEWAKADPYVTAGIYAEVRVQPFKKTFPQ